ncbi:MAG TPA: TrkH family potassium uptake protein [Aliiroseovarius sp.]|nr:TrkH family potassium uptake protein [Aliiroseovarius sp.]
MALGFNRLPLMVYMMAVTSVLMLVPAIHAVVIQDIYVAQVFFYSGLLFGFLTLFLAIAMNGRPASGFSRVHLLALLGIFTLLPVMMAVPVHQALRDTSFLNAYVEMVSSLTTTGATLFEGPGRLPPSVHLWRALVGWLGGLIMWVGAIAILAPMALGGFEVRAASGAGGAFSNSLSQGTGGAGMDARIRTYALRLAPIYAGLTTILWIALLLAGDTSLVALTHAMSTMATSGISAVGGLSGGGAGIMGEVLVALFLIFAVSRLAFVRDGRAGDTRNFLADPEVRLAFSLVAVVTVFLLLRHWWGAYEVDEVLDLSLGLQAAWGTAFTLFSFLTTAGFESAFWNTGQDWSGLQTPGLVLMGLALVGGGVATTAGGAKLLRVYALFKHSERELERLVNPHSVGGAGDEARHIRSQGAYLSWLFFMLMAMSVAGFMAAFSLTGEGFETSMVLTIAALTTTGPLAALAAPEPISYALLPVAAKLILTAAMVVGRLETLAIVALLNPDIWRR